MNQLFIYTLKVNGSLLLFYLFYLLMYRRDTFLKIRRAYLLTAVLFSFLYPLMQFGTWFQQQKTVQIFASAINLNEIVITAHKTAPSVFTTENILFSVYVLITFALIFKIILQTVSILLKTRRGEKTEIDGVEVIHLNENITPFSFFNFIFINKNQHSQSEIPEILTHELSHVRQRHSYDVVLSEILTALCWFNPFAWLLKKEIKQNLEFLADNQVITSGFETKKYQYLLLNISCNYVDNQLINQFNISPIKKRITMMNKPKTSGKGLIKYTLIVPIVLIMLVVSNVQDVVAELQNSTQKKSTVYKKETVKFNTPKKQNSKKETVKFVAPVIKKDSVYEIVENPPIFPNGENSLMKFLAENIKYPVVAQENGVMGKVIVKFIVSKEGKVIDAIIVKTEMKEPKQNLEVVGYGTKDKNAVTPTKETLDKAKLSLENEALRVVNMMPQWIPGKNKGENVNVQYYLPINFSLQ